MLNHYGQVIEEQQDELDELARRLEEYERRGAKPRVLRIASTRRPRSRNYCHAPHVPPQRSWVTSLSSYLLNMLGLPNVKRPALPRVATGYRTALICPRISPFWFFEVWTFT